MVCSVKDMVDFYMLFYDTKFSDFPEQSRAFRLIFRVRSISIEFRVILLKPFKSNSKHKAESDLESVNFESAFFHSLFKTILFFKNISIYISQCAIILT